MFTCETISNTKILSYGYRILVIKLSRNKAKIITIKWQSYITYYIFSELYAFNTCDTIANNYNNFISHKICQSFFIRYVI